jgi:hypothetical protein
VTVTKFDTDLLQNVLLTSVALAHTENVPKARDYTDRVSCPFSRRLVFMEAKSEFTSPLMVIK